jgi:ribose 5-phosphate isomerase RpiB
MKIALINEVSAVEKNAAIYEALSRTGHTIINAGMKKKGEEPELTYIETGFMTGLLLNAKLADFVVGGCGTGQGYLNSAMQYPNVFCGLILDPLDAWLFPQINEGNAVSLALNKGYGWAGDKNLGFMFQRMLEVEWGAGYPPHRQISQRNSRERLKDISVGAHKSFMEIVDALDPEMVKKVADFPGIKELFEADEGAAGEIKDKFLSF